MSNNKQDISSGNYRAVIPIVANGMANPERPNADSGNGGISLLPMVNLVDQTGNAIGVPGNTLSVDATFGGNVEVGGIAHEFAQSFPENSVNPLQQDLEGNLKVTIPNALPTGSNFIGNVAISAMPPVTAVTTAAANAAVQSFANGTANALQADTQGALKVNIVAGGASSDFAGPTGDNVPTYASYTGFSDLTGKLSGVSNSTPFPVTVTNVAAVSQDGTWNVGLNSGSNTIGKVDLNSGSNTIGKVDLNAGTNAIGSITNTSFGISGSLPAGTNNIGIVTLSAGSGTIGAVSIAPGSNAIGSITNTSFGISGSLPVGSNVIGKIDLNSALPVGSNIIGKVSIDQSTPGTTNYVTAGQNGTWNVGLNAGTNFIGSINNTGFNITSAIPSGSNNIGVTGVQQGVGASSIYGDLVQGVVSTSSPTYSAGLVQPISLDTSGNLRVNVVAGGGSGANIGLVGSTAPTSAAYIAYANSGGILTGVTTSAPLPTQTFDITSTGTIQALAQTVVVATNSFDTVGFQVTGTFTGSIAVEASIDGTNYISTTFVSLASGGSASFFSVPTIGQINCVGLPYVRFRANAWTSGTAVFTTVSSVGVSNVMLDNPIPIGTNNIGTVGYVQNSTTSTQYGTLIQGAVTTAAPTYTSGQTSPLSLDTGGLLRVNVVSGGGATTAIANAATQSFANGTANSLQADTTGALKVNVIATVGGGSSGGGAANAIANASTQSFASGSSNVLQADLTGGLKIVGTSANATTTAGNPVLIGGTNGTNTYSIAVNAVGQPLMATRTAQVQVNPTLTSASAYASGNCVGGKLTFDNIVGSQLSGVLQSINIVSKSTQSAGFKFYLFTTNPTNTTFTNKAAVTINAADLPYLIGQFAINAYDNGLGTMTIYPFDNVGKSFVATTTSLYGVLVTTGTPTFTSTTDLFITLTVLQD